jgi:hypothetical protein
MSIKHSFLFLLLLPALVNAQQKKYNSSLAKACIQYKSLYDSLPANEFPRNINSKGELVTNKSNWWTSGFFPGTLWYLYQYSKDSALKRMAISKTNQLLSESLNTRDHDIGFKIWCSLGNQFRLTKDSNTLPVILTAAKSLSRRYNEKVKAIRSWGNINDTGEYIVIIDNMMNLELLFETTKLTGDSSFYKIAVAHANTTLANHFRPDGSSYHVVAYDMNTGTARSKRTAQGAADSSAWSRGQAWALYGFTMCYRETGDEKYLAQAKKIARFILYHPNLPTDKIPYWDLNAPNIPNALRDASSAAIIASALLELSQYADKENKKRYTRVAEQILFKLSSPEYRTKVGEKHNFLLQHSVGHLPAKSEVDTPLSYADYYYIEALMKLKNQNNY